MGQGQNTGSIGNIRYDGNKITVEGEPDSIGDVSITTAFGRVQCFWDGVQWVCNSIGFSTSQSANAGQAYGK
jgi:hypothetical protein